MSRLIRPPAWLGGCTNAMEAGEVIACANTLLHLPTRETLPHTPRFFTLNALPFDYRHDAPEPKEWLAFLRTIWPGDHAAIDTLQEAFGLCLTGETKYQKAFLIVGPKRSGKGTIARTLTDLLGAANVAGPTLSSLAQNFGLEPLIGKRLAIVSDARLGGKIDQQVIVERLLSITGEDSLTIDRKHRAHWTGKLDARFLILTNELPRLTDSSGALASRFVILTMTRSFFGKEDLALGNKLAHELPGILLWALRGWDRLNARGYFKPPASSDAAQADLENLGSPIGAFLRDMCALDPALSVNCDGLFQEWRDWCRDQGRDHAGTAQTFGRDLKAAVATLTVKQVTDPKDKTRHRYYEGIGLDPARDNTRARPLRAILPDDPGPGPNPYD